MSEYPKMLFRAGTSFMQDGKMLDSLIVGGGDEEGVARDEGFTDLAEALAAEETPTKGVLDHTAAEIAEMLPSIADDELLALLEAEEGGKTRKGVIAAIKAEIERR